MQDTVSLLCLDNLLRQQSPIRLAGQRIEAPVKGLNIVKMSDGRTMKVIVK